MRLLDTNISVYADGRDHPYRDSCNRIIEWLESDARNYVTNTEILQEILHVYNSRREMSRGIRLVENLLRLLPAVIPITATEIRTAVRLLRETPGLSSRDAIHAAVVIEHGLEGIVSADRIFERIVGIRRYDPIDVAPG